MDGLFWGLQIPIEIHDDIDLYDKEGNHVGVKPAPFGAIFEGMGRRVHSEGEAMQYGGPPEELAIAGKDALNIATFGAVLGSLQGAKLGDAKWMAENKDTVFAGRHEPRRLRNYAVILGGVRMGSKYGGYLGLFGGTYSLAVQLLERQRRIRDPSNGIMAGAVAGAVTSLPTLSPRVTILSTLLGAVVGGCGSILQIAVMLGRKEYTPERYVDPIEEVREKRRIKKAMFERDMMATEAAILDMQLGMLDSDDLLKETKKLADGQQAKARE
eukprot:Clim_evm69s142 gene=Clim_evmTU69s142